MTLALVVGLVACNSPFFGTESKPKAPEVHRPPPAKVAARPKECQVVMDLIKECGVPLEPTRIQAVAECGGPTYLGDTELMAFLRCMGDAPNCDQLARCSGPVGAAPGGTPEPSGAAAQAPGAGGK